MTNETHIQPILKVLEKEGGNLGKTLCYEQHQKEKRRLSKVIHRAPKKKLCLPNNGGEETEHADRRKISN